MGRQLLFPKPLDWLVLFQEINVPKAFPNGRKDFDKITQRVSPAPEFYPLVEGFEREGGVMADLAFSRFDIVSYLNKAAMKFILSDQAEEGIEFPKTDALYVMRGIGPAFLPPEDFNFVQEHYEEPCVRAVAINLISAIIDLSSAAITPEGFRRAFKEEKTKLIIIELVNEILKEAPKISSERSLSKWPSI